MEVAQLLTNGKINLYFGEIDKLEGDDHLSAYIKVLKSIFNTIKPFLDDNIRIEAKKSIGMLDGVKKSTFFSNIYIYNISQEYLYDNRFLKSLYFSENTDIILKSNRLKMIFYSDPVVIDIEILS